MNNDVYYVSSSLLGQKYVRVMSASYEDNGLSLSALDYVQVMKKYLPKELLSKECDAEESKPLVETPL